MDIFNDLSPMLLLIILAAGAVAFVITSLLRQFNVISESSAPLWTYVVHAGVAVLVVALGYYTGNVEVNLFEAILLVTVALMEGYGIQQIPVIVSKVMLKDSLRVQGKRNPWLW